MHYLALLRGSPWQARTIDTVLSFLSQISHLPSSCTFVCPLFLSRMNFDDILWSIRTGVRCRSKTTFQQSFLIWVAVQCIREWSHTFSPEWWSVVWFADGSKVLAVTKRRKYEDVSRSQVRRIAQEFSISGSRVASRIPTRRRAGYRTIGLAWHCLPSFIATPPFPHIS